MKARKTPKRKKLVSELLERLVSNHKTLNYKNIDEDKIKTSAVPRFTSLAKDYYQKQGLKGFELIQTASKTTQVKTNKENPIETSKLFGLKYTPDMVYTDIETNTKVAFKIKRGYKDDIIRQMIGDSLIYSADYDFVICLIIDISDDQRIFNSVDNDSEKEFIKLLWEKSNIVIRVL